MSSSIPQAAYVVRLVNYDPKNQTIVPTNYYTVATGNAYNRTVTSNYNTAGAIQQPSPQQSQIQQSRAQQQRQQQQQQQRAQQAIIAQRAAQVNANGNYINGSLVQYIQPRGQTTAVRPSYVVPTPVTNNQFYSTPAAAITHVTPPPPTRQAVQLSSNGAVPNGGVTSNGNVSRYAAVLNGFTGNQTPQQPQQYYGRRPATPPIRQQRRSSTPQVPRRSANRSPHNQYYNNGRRSSTPTARHPPSSRRDGSPNYMAKPINNGQWFDAPPPPPSRPPPKPQRKPEPKLPTVKDYFQKEREKMQQRVETQFLYNEMTKHKKSKADKAADLLKLTIEQQNKKTTDKVLLTQRKKRQIILKRELADEQRNLTQIVQNLQYHTTQFRQAQQTGKQGAVYPQVRELRMQQQEAINKINKMTKELEEIGYRTEMSQKAEFERQNERRLYGINHANDSYYNGHAPAYNPYNNKQSHY
eukprot:153381_1